MYSPYFFSLFVFIYVICYAQFTNVAKSFLTVYCSYSLVFVCFFFVFLTIIIAQLQSSAYFIFNDDRLAWLMVCLISTRTRSISIARATQLVPGLGLLFEHRSRRLEIALYCAPRAIESLYKDLVSNGTISPYVFILLLLCCWFFVCLFLCKCSLFPFEFHLCVFYFILFGYARIYMSIDRCTESGAHRIPHETLLMGCVASAGILYCYEQQEGSLRPGIAGALRWLWK